MVLAAQESIKQHSYNIPNQVNRGVFRTYDIRGEVGDDSINPNLAYAIGLAIGSEAQACGQHKLCVGRDGRLSAPEIAPALIAGLLESGIDVIDIGRVPTPLLYFATHYLKTHSGVMVTASHNPANHNGFKMVLDGKSLTTDRVQDLYRRIIEKDVVRGTGQLSEADVKPAYVDYITQHIQLKKKFKVVLDCGNGIAGEIAPQLFRALGCEVVELFCEVDGRFPNHHPDPTIPDNLKDIIATVAKTHADVGLAFDGDADRLGVVSNTGDIIWPDRQITLFAKDLLTRQPGATIVYDVKCTRYLSKVVEDNGGKAVMSRTGHSMLKSKMLELDAAFAGEMSGHIFFREGWFGFDDGMYVGVRLLDVLARDGHSVSELFASLPYGVSTPELKLPMAEDKKAAFMQRLIADADFAEAEKITIDGLRVEFSKGWGLVRRSNTSPYLILRFEADNEADLQQIKDCFRQQLLAIDASLADSLDALL